MPTSSRSPRRRRSTGPWRSSGVDHLPPAVACIGPVTAEAARAHGLAVDVEARVHTISGLVDAVTMWAASIGRRG